MPHKLFYFIIFFSYFFSPSVSIDHIFDNLESGKRNLLFWKKSAKSLDCGIRNMYEPCVNDKKSFTIRYF